MAEPRRKAAPVTRSASFSAFCPSNPAPPPAAPADAPPRKTRLSNKRPAVNDENCDPLKSGLLQPARKRAALSSLTNNVTTRNNAAHPCKPNGAIQSKSKNQIVAAHHVQESQKGVLAAQVNQQKQVEVKEEKVAVIQSKKFSQNQESHKLKSGKTAIVNGPNTVQEEKIVTVASNVLNPEASLVESKRIETLASPTDRVQQNFSVKLRDPTLTHVKDALFEPQVEGQGWSCENYIDIDENKDPQMCSTYAADIYFHLRTAELKKRPVMNFIETVQQDINASMRGVLVDWLVEVAEEYKLVPDTLYLAITYIDRFLSGNVVDRQRLQLLGVSCMLIASKYEEICPPQVDEFCYITDNTYTRVEVLEMEKKVLDRLNFDLAGPTTKTFLRRFIRAANTGHKISTLQLEFLGNYLAELTLLEYDFLCYLPSMIASSAVFLAKVTLDPTGRPWNATLHHYSGYKPSDLKDCVRAIHNLQCNKKNCTLAAVRDKYKQPKFKSVAKLPSLASISLKYFEDVYDTLAT